MFWTFPSSSAWRSASCFLWETKAGYMAVAYRCSAPIKTSGFCCFFSCHMHHKLSIFMYFLIFSDERIVAKKCQEGTMSKSTYVVSYPWESWRFPCASANVSRLCPASSTASSAPLASGTFVKCSEAKQRVAVPFKILKMTVSRSVVICCGFKMVETSPMQSLGASGVLIRRTVTSVHLLTPPGLTTILSEETLHSMRGAPEWRKPWSKTGGL